MAELEAIDESYGLEDLKIYLNVQFDGYRVALVRPRLESTLLRCLDAVVVQLKLRWSIANLPLLLVNLINALLQEGWICI